MGYTHYWKMRKCTNKDWSSFVNDCKKLKSKLPKTTETAGGYYGNEPLKIAGWDGTGRAILSEKTINFNGKGEELSHENFCIEKEKKNWNFCKTSRKPYDLLVVACLIAGWQNNVLYFASDGFNDDGTCEDLQPALDYYNQVMQRDLKPEDLFEQRNHYYKKK